ncbi:MAG: DUF3574 domain-containing protein [Verrucomicrobiae bacterium]|nr:DUF3574 domain-containing protein [Verrucomicrobiae bacterium]
MKLYLPIPTSNVAPIVILVFLSVAGFNTLAQSYSASGIQTSSSQTEPASKTGWLKTELYYGAGRLPADGSPDERWENYINEVVTPRFPEGLTLLEGTGQWRVKPGQPPRRHRSRILILIHEDTPEKSRLVDEIRSIWLEISGHQSVLRVSQPVEVSM